jgi:hypothetical protein
VGEGFQFGGIYPWWVLAPLAALVLGITLLSYRKAYKWLPVRRRGALMTLRFLWVTVMVLAALKPELHVIRHVVDVPSLIVMVDRSLSMSEPDEQGGRTRYEEAVSAVQAVWPSLKRARERFQITLAAFGEDAVQAASPDQMPPPDAKKTDLTHAFEWVMERSSLPSVGLVLFTDGAADDYPEVIEAAERLKSMRLSVYSVGMGRPSMAPDTWIAAVHAPEEMPAREPTMIPVDIAYSFPAPGEHETTMTVFEDGKPVDTMPVTYYGLGNIEPFNFRYLPTSPGYHELEFRLRPLRGESRLENNGAKRVVHVLPVDLSVLFLTQGFSPESAFMANALSTLKGVRVTTKPVIKNMPDRPFDLKNNELDRNYDVLVLDCRSEPAFEDPEFKDVVRYVHNGGGMLFIPGPGLSGSIGLLNDMFSADVVFERRMPTGGLPIGPGSDIQALSTLSPRPAENRNLWARMPLLDYVFTVSGIKDMQVPLRAASGEPALAITRAGQGVVAILLAGPTFRWQLDSGAKQELYSRFVTNLFTHIARRAEGKDVLQCRPGKLFYRVGEKISADITGPQDLADVAVALFRKDLGLETATVKMEGGRGKYEAGVELSGGVYQLRVAAGEKLAEAAFSVEEVRGEADHIVPEHGLLEMVSGSTGGYFARGREGGIEVINERLSQPPPPPRLVAKKIPIMPFYFYMAMFLVASASEWYLRRRWGLV